MAISKPQVQLEGLSTETKPLTYGIGSTFCELNTGDWYRFHGMTLGWLPFMTHGVAMVTNADHLTSTTVEYTSTSGGDIVATALITPPSGLHIGVYSYSIKTEATSGVINIDYATSSVMIARLYPARTDSGDDSGLHLEGATDEPITISASGIGNTQRFFIIINTAIHYG